MSGPNISQAEMWNDRLRLLAAAGDLIQKSSISILSELYFKSHVRVTASSCQIKEQQHTME